MTDGEIDDQFPNIPEKCQDPILPSEMKIFWLRQPTRAGAVRHHVLLRHEDAPPFSERLHFSRKNGREAVKKALASSTWKMEKVFISFSLGIWINCHLEQ